MGLELSLSKKQKMQNVQEYTVVEEEVVSKQDNSQEEPFLVMQRLMSEEANLMEEKENLHAQLASLRKKRDYKIQRTIRAKKNNIQKLKSEIKDLKFSCEELSKTLRQARATVPKVN